MLYAISGCVSAIFIIVIVSGAIRALRHPERYGPRRQGENGAPQSRARGLTRAIIDTFPLVKFAASSNAPMVSQQTDTEKNKNPYNSSAIDLENCVNVSSSPEISSSMPPSSSSTSPIPNPSRPISAYLPVTVGRADEPRRHSTASLNRQDDVIPSQIGRETCPICIVDFEEGDDIRVLPCDGKHCFHQQCVDPWLLKLSSACPICRHGALTRYQLSFCFLIFNRCHARFSGS